MKIETLRAVLNTGDKHGSGIRQMLADLKISDLSNVTQAQAECWLKERESMTSKTTEKIANWSKDKYTQESLLKLMDYYGVSSLRAISEEQGIAFLRKLERGEIK